MKLTKSPGYQGLHTQRKGLEIWWDASAITKQHRVTYTDHFYGMLLYQSGKTSRHWSLWCHGSHRLKSFEWCTVTLTFPVVNISRHRPYDDHVARGGSQSVDEGAENRNSHVRGETSAAVLGVRTLAQPHGRTAACWEGGGHAAAVVKDLVKREKLQCSGKTYWKWFAWFHWSCWNLINSYEIINDLIYRRCVSSYLIFS